MHVAYVTNANVKAGGRPSSKVSECMWLGYTMSQKMRWGGKQEQKTGQLKKRGVYYLNLGFQKSFLAGLVKQTWPLLHLFWFYVDMQATDLLIC